MHLQAGIEPLIVIGIMIASAIYQAIQKKRQDAETWEEWNQPSEPPVAPRRPVPSPAPPQPPPLARRYASPAPPLPPPVMGPPPVITEPVLQPTGPVWRNSPLQQKPMAVPHDHEAHEGPDGELTNFEESQKAYARASNLQQRIHDRMAEIDRKTALHVPTGIRLRTKTDAAARVMKSFRQPETVRQAFLAAFVLHPPKSLEEPTVGR